MTEQTRPMGTVYHFPVVYQNENGSFGVTVIGLDGIFTTGQTLQIAKVNAQAAIRQHLASLGPDQLTEIEPYKIKPEDVELEVLAVTLANGQDK